MMLAEVVHEGLLAEEGLRVFSMGTGTEKKKRSAVYFGSIWESRGKAQVLLLFESPRRKGKKRRETR